MKTYILLKDISQPNDYDVKAGEVFRKVSCSVDSAYSNGKRSFSPSVVENNPEWFKEEIKRPPIGIIPEWLWVEERLASIQEAVARYREANYDIPKEWENEINQLGLWLRMRFGKG